MFNEVTGEVLDTCIIGPKKNPGTNLRLIKTKKNNLLIQSYSNMMEAWVIMYRYGDIQKQWDSWKRIEKSINERKKSKRKPVDTRNKGKSGDKGTVSGSTKRRTKSSRVG
jgi:hypothetical protein